MGQRDTGAKGNNEGKGKMSGLCHHRDLEIWKLPEDVTREQFILWRDQLDELLELSPGWRGSTEVLEKIRDFDDVVTPAMVNMIETDNGHDLDDHKATVEQVREKSEELYSLLRLKHNTTTNGLSKDVEGRNGFEVYRKMASEYDPRPAGTVALILDTVMGIGKHECANLDETYKTIANPKIH